MTHVLDPLPAKYTDRILCYYVNFTRKLQIIRVINISGWHFECIVFPTERILFEALPEAQLEVHTTRLGCPILLEYIACNRLRTHEGSDASPPLNPESVREPIILNQVKSVKSNQSSLINF